MLFILCLSLVYFHISCQAAVLFEGATIISFDEVSERLVILKDASLLVVEDRITALSSDGNSLPSLPDNTTIVNATGQIISPGFVDTHHHIWETVFRTLASNTTLSDYTYRYWYTGPANQALTPEDVYLSELSGCLELMNTGTTTVVDFAHGAFSDAAINAAVNATFDSGMRVVFAQFIAGGLPFPNFSFEDLIQKVQSLANDERFSNGLVSLGLSYDEWSMSPIANVSRVWNLTQELNLSVVTTHYLGGPWGVYNSPAFFNSLNYLNNSMAMIFAHGSFMTPLDASLLRSTNQYLATCPEAEMHMGQGHEYSHLIQDQASLGTDISFTFSAGMVNQARIWMQSLRNQNYLDTLNKFEVPANNPMSVEQAFLLITRHGGLALKRDDIGVIKEGAKADLAVFSTRQPNMWGASYDPIAAVILHSSTSDVEHVMINGVFVKVNGTMTMDGYEGIRERFEASATRVQNTWAGIDWAQIEAGYSAGQQGFWVGSYGATDEIDVQRGNGTGYGNA